MQVNSPSDIHPPGLSAAESPEGEEANNQEYFLKYCSWTLRQLLCGFLAMNSQVIMVTATENLQPFSQVATSPSFPSITLYV